MTTRKVLNGKPYAGNLHRLIAVCVAFSALAASAYLAPVEERCGVRVEIGSFPQKTERPGKNPYAWPLGVTEVEAGAPRTFPVTLENRTGMPIAGELEVWMNDDWDVSGPQGPLKLDVWMNDGWDVAYPKGPIVLESGEKKELLFTGTARPRALNALYPVHARFTPNGVKKEDAPHPVAVFMYKNPHAPRPVRKVSAPKLGPQPKVPDEVDWKARCATALAAAKAARASGTDAVAGRWRLDANGVVYGAGVAYGARGLIDGALAFTDGEKSVVFRGFTARVDTGDGSAPPEAKASIREEKGTLRISWSIPGVTRDATGFPRIADLAVGPASEKPHRVYMGFGNVIEGPRAFTFVAHGSRLSTRHVGADYANGLSVAQAVDVVQDSVVCDGERNLFSLHAHHDATFTFVPSSKGSFEAGRRFRAVSGYKASPGHAALGSRMCLDLWGCDYAMETAGIARAAKYGLNDSIFVQHVWQRWGYDFRLPDIYPPAGGEASLKALREACRAAGILFCLHDNYTDIYPDCDGYSYDLTVFNLDGTPQRAWFNAWRHARSYRWAPHAFHPWCIRNAKLLKAGCDPDAICIDVFTALCPFDYLDRAGRFHSKNETSANWGRGFQLYRQYCQRPDMVCVSEGGQDHLVGIADAGESDHIGAPQLIGRGKFADSERTPWHDIVTHGYYVLFAGGLGIRYQGGKGGNAQLHGYASDDYLSNCIIGGRNPMSDGPFSRNAVKTYWLQHDACAELGRAEFLDLKYEGNIHRQHSFFSDGGEVWVNRQTNAPWRLPNGIVLPPYGYYARTRNTTSGVVEKDGVRCAFAKSPNGMFVEARNLPVGRTVDFGGVKTDGTFRFADWMITPLPHSKAFSAEIDLAAFGAAGRAVAGVDAVDPEKGAAAPTWSQTGNVLKIACDAKAFAYRIRLRFPHELRTLDGVPQLDVKVGGFWLVFRVSLCDNVPVCNSEKENMP